MDQQRPLLFAILKMENGLSRLTDLLAQVKQRDATLGQELEQEFKVLSSRRSFGLNFERHRPESVELPGDDHHLMTSASRTRMLQAIDAFLAKNLPVG